MTGQEHKRIVAEAKQAKQRLRAPYAALKTMAAERTGKKGRRFELVLSEQDRDIALLMSEELGISMGCLFRLLAQLAFKEWSDEQQAAEDEAFYEQLDRDLGL